MGKSYRPLPGSVSVVLEFSPQDALVVRALVFHDAYKSPATWVLDMIIESVDSILNTEDMHDVEEYFDKHMHGCSADDFRDFLRRRGVEPVPYTKLTAKRERVKDEPGASVPQEPPATEQAL